MLLDGTPILLHTIRKFAACPSVTRDRGRVARRGHAPGSASCWRAKALAKPVRLVEGGDTRQQSVENALAALGPDIDLVAVHDAVRPFIEPATHREGDSGGGRRAARPSWASSRWTPSSRSSGTRSTARIPRDRLVLAQTPQVFRHDLLERAFAKAREDGFTGTDESSLVERLEQVEVSVVPGSDRNIKITKPTDMDLARLFLSEEAEQARTAS